MMKAKSRLSEHVAKMGAMAVTKTYQLLKSTRGQGTTEYAVLVGVLVVIAIIAVVAFRGKIQELWSAISEGVNSL